MGTNNDDVNRQDKHSANGPEKQGPSGADVVDFLKNLRPNGPWVLTAFLPEEEKDKPFAVTITAHTASEAERFYEKHNGIYNLYYSTNPTKTDMTKKAAKTDIAAIEYLLADLDPNDGESSEDAKTRYLKQLNGNFEPKPTAIVDSGNGIQCLWRLTERIVLGAPSKTTDDKGKTKLVFSPEDQAKIDDAETRSKALMERLGAEAGTQNIDRILRLPGTVNLPNAKKLKAGREKCPTKLLEFNGVSYPLDAFVPGTPEDGGHHARQEHEDEDEDEEQGAHEGSGDKLERIIREGESGEFKGDRSSAVWWVVNEMLRRHYVTSAIVSTLLDHNNKISDHVYAQKQPRQYAERQVAKAKSKIPEPKVEVLPASQWFGECPAPFPATLVKGIFPQTGVATIGGQSGTGKSFHAIHLGVRLIPDCNQHFYIDKYRIKRHGGVLYLVLEGKPSFPLRVTAAFEQLLNKQMTFGEEARLPFCWNTYAPSLFEKGPDNLLRLVDRERQRMRQEFSVDLVAIFLDTMGLAACYENENMAAQVQRVVAGLQKVSDETGALCINVDHMGKDTDAGMRGTSAKRDCVETILACFCDRNGGDKPPTNHRMQLLKIRDGEEGRVIPYRLEQVDMGVDEDHERVTTAVVRWEPNRPVQKKRQQKNSRTDVVLELAIKETGLPVEEQRLREVFYAKHGGGNKAANRAWHLALKGSWLRVGADGLLYEV